MVGPQPFLNLPVKRMSVCLSDLILPDHDYAYNMRHHV